MRQCRRTQVRSGNRHGPGSVRHDTFVVDLEFEDVGAAHACKGFLETVVWQSRDLSPGLDGPPTARVLDDVENPTG